MADVLNYCLHCSLYGLNLVGADRSLFEFSRSYALMQRIYLVSGECYLSDTNIHLGAEALTSTSFIDDIKAIRDWSWPS